MLFANVYPNNEIAMIGCFPPMLENGEVFIDFFLCFPLAARVRRHEPDTGRILAISELIGWDSLGRAFEY